MAGAYVEIRNVDRKGRASVLALCGVCGTMVPATVRLEEDEFIKHNADQEKHFVGVLKRRRRRWVVADPPDVALDAAYDSKSTKQTSRQKAPYPYVYMPVVTNNVGRGKQQ